MPKKTCYWLCAVLCVGAYIWLYIQNNYEEQAGMTVCFSKLFYGLPCPACGVTRGVLLLLQCRFEDAFIMNPNSFPVLLVLFSVTVLLFVDLFLRSQRLYDSYLYLERVLNHKVYLYPFLLIELLIWIYNIYRGV